MMMKPVEGVLVWMGSRAFLLQPETVLSEGLELRKDEGRGLGQV